MIGKFIKKIWKDWPEYEMLIKAEDLNKYENTLDEHDKRLKELADIDNRMNDSEQKIKEFNKISLASQHAKNYIEPGDTPKCIGLFMAGTTQERFVYQISKMVDLSQVDPDGNGMFAITELIPYDSAYVRRMIGCDIATWGRHDQQAAYTGNYSPHGIKLESYYDPVTRSLNIQYSGINCDSYYLIITVKYTEETA